MTQRQTEILDLLMSGKSQAQIARDLKVTPQYVSQTVRGEPFQAELKKRKSAAIQQGLLRLQNNFGNAATVALQICRDESVAPQVRLNAAQTVMSQCKNWTETADILERLDALEEAAKRNSTY